MSSCARMSMGKWDNCESRCRVHICRDFPLPFLNKSILTLHHSPATEWSLINRAALVSKKLISNESTYRLCLWQKSKWLLTFGVLNTPPKAKTPLVSLCVKGEQIPSWSANGLMELTVYSCSSSCFFLELNWTGPLSFPIILEESRETTTWSTARNTLSFHICTRLPCLSPLPTSRLTAGVIRKLGHSEINWLVKMNQLT